MIDTSSLYPDLDLTTFPNSVDQQYVMIDPSTTTDLTAIDSYNAYIDAGNLASALQVLADNPRLQKMLFNAAKWNRHENMIIAMQRFYDSDVQDYIVNLVTYRGAWNDTSAYSKYDVVYWTNDEADECYMAIQNTVAGILPNNQTYYVPITLRGQQGTPGTGLSWRGEWTSTTAYYANDAVSYNNKIWAAKAASTGQIPADGSTYWDAAIAVDMSASSILEKMKTVDGSGSGLDADTLDGNHAAYFVSAATYSAHTHGNISNDGKVGTEADKAVYTGESGSVTAGVLPIAAGGTGSSDAATARTNLGAAAFADLTTHIADGSKHFGINPTADVDGTFYRGTTSPTGTTVLNYSGYFEATRVYGSYYSDYAECFDVQDDFVAGDVVAISGNNGFRVCQIDKSPLAFGVVSDNYYICIGVKSETANAPIALCGKVPVNIIGDCRPGQWLVSSSTKGYARVLRDGEEAPLGCILGQALSMPSANKVLMLVNRR